VLAPGQKNARLLKKLADRGRSLAGEGSVFQQQVRITRTDAAAGKSVEAAEEAQALGPADEVNLVGARAASQQYAGGLVDVVGGFQGKGRYSSSSLASSRSVL